jgi:hypothetical protein
MEKSMSDMKKQIVTTPIGETKWFSVSKVDKFGNYTCELHLDESERSEKFIDFLETFGSGKKPFEKTPEGYKVKLKSKSQGTKRDNSTYTINAPAIYNNLGQRVSGAELEGLSIGNGSKIRAKIEVKQYNFMGQDGVSIGLKSVQVVEAVAYSGGGQDYGFEATEVEEANRESSEQEALTESENYDF